MQSKEAIRLMKVNGKVLRWWDELNACLVLRGGVKRHILSNPGVEQLLIDCVKNNISVKFSLPEVLHGYLELESHYVEK